MSQNFLLPVTPPLPVDWRPRQGRWFASVTTPVRRLAERLGVSPRTVERWGDCTTPLPLHHSFLAAVIAADDRLLRAYSRDVQQLVVPCPRPLEGRSITMEVYLTMQQDCAALGPLVYKLMSRQGLTQAEREQYLTICEDIAKQAIALQQLLDAEGERE
jgi:hypothetical protein